MSKELLFSLTKKDFEIQFYRGTGNGGQNRNKVETAVRIKHLESGAVASCEEQRTQEQNKKIAFERLVKTKEFQSWHKRKTAELMMVIPTKEEMEKQVDEMLKSENIKIEHKENDKWVKEE